MRARILSIIALLVCTLFAPAATAQRDGPSRPSQQPQLDPILRIDPGMHTAMTKRIGVDAGCTLLATGSDDKTVMVWRLPEGKHLRTLRPPIGPGHDGKLFAVTMSPDGTWIAAGGWDAGHAVLHSNYVYIFETGTGTIVARVGQQDGKVVNHLTVSPDGRYLAITRHLGQGVEVWEKVGAGLTNWRLVGRDSNYGTGPAYGAAFDRSGALYVVGYDSKLRRYAPGYRERPVEVDTRSGRRPYSVAAHPSGDRVAVGYEDVTMVDVFDAPSLRWRFSADTRGINNGDLASVAWSADGSRLYAAGSYATRNRNVILSWDRAGEGRLRELPGPQNTVTQLLSCRGDMVFAAQDPNFGIVGPGGEYRLWPAAVQADLRGQYGEQGIAVSADGRRVRFGLESMGRNPVLFDLPAERVVDAPNMPDDLVGADTRSLPISDWAHHDNPRLSGTPIRLERYEKSRAIAIAPDRERFVLGADWSLRGFERGGREIWNRATHGTLWGVNIPRNGKLVVAAHGDGTIRWHRLTDGQELLALFVHAKDRRWVAWTPKGYYMASPGAESLIGWHVNKGWEEASQFFSVDRFRDQFNRPDIVKLALLTGDETRAIQEANLKANIKRPVEDVRALAPPILVIQKPDDNSTFRSPEVTLQYYAFSPTGQRITDIDVRVNNQALATRAALPPGPRSMEPMSVKIPLPQEDVTITMVAREGTRASQPVTLKLRWEGAAKLGQPQRPRLRALFVGVNDYVSPNLTRLQFAAKDAMDLASFFKAQEGRTYYKVEARVLPNAKRADVLDALEWMERQSEEGDINLLFLAGHGITDEQQHFYYMAADSDPERARSTGVARDEILRTIRNRKGAMVVMLDACHSADTAAASKNSRVDMNRLANELGDKSLGVFLYASALGRQFSFENADWQNGAFTKAMLEGLKGGADRDKLGYVDTEELSLYVRRRVLQMTDQRQEPVRMKPDATPELRLVLLK
jgi:WD40 repeat protein